ncbi:MAG: tetratricopeptide repeat protein [Candidatus Amulumruptor caecigallinarius]|nr:tetratricopeptide repeat protein [Candidatus Amulumruptor caecigallinarius]MCM1396213.1 tetratricopeptide repeat protein [Candidatus Amulumruptor caecigallinarius]MCM1453787.1 tetratricopeptide repeat protein [bacterium]
MKKTSLVALALCAGLAASAQISLVKDAQKSFKPGKTKYTEWLNTIKPAFTNAESSENVLTYYVPAKAGYENFDHEFVLLRAGQDVDVNDMGTSIINAYEFALKALPLDSLPNEKGQVKPKYSKELIKLAASHYDDYDNAARYLYNAKDWANAYKAWDIYFDAPTHPALAKEIKISPDSLLATNAYLQGYVASQMERYDDAIRLFNKAIELGNTDKNLFNQAMYISKITNNPDQMYAFAEKGYQVHGTEVPVFFQLTIEGKLQHKQFDEAKQLLDKGLAEDPKNPVYNIAMGALYENQGDKDQALSYYRKAAEFDPQNGDAYYNIGRMLAEQSDAIAEGAGAGISESQFHQLEQDKINPLRREAAAAFEKCYELSENHNALQYLKNIYYVLKDNANFERVNNLY